MVFYPDLRTILKNQGRLVILGNANSMEMLEIRQQMNFELNKQTKRLNKGS